MPPLIELVFEACLLMQPAQCHTVSLTFADVSLIQCTMGVGAQAEVSKWLAVHPGYSARRHRCRVAGQFAKA